MSDDNAGGIIAGAHPLRNLVGAVIVIAVTAAILYRYITYGGLSPIGWAALLASMFTALIGVYGARAFSRAMDAVDNITGDDT